MSFRWTSVFKQFNSILWHASYRPWRYEREQIFKPFSFTLHLIGRWRAGHRASVRDTLHNAPTYCGTCLYWARGGTRLPYRRVREHACFFQSFKNVVFDVAIKPGLVWLLCQFLYVTGKNHTCRILQAFRPAVILTECNHLRRCTLLF